MKSRELILLTPYRIPGRDPFHLGTDDILALLHGWSALWHPAALRGAIGPPRLASPYDYEQPTAGHVYAVPQTPPLVLPEDWEQRVLDAGAVTFRSTDSREGTLANLRAALSVEVEAGTELAPPPAAQAEDAAGDAALLALGPEELGPFFGIGLGYLMVETLYEAMEHEQLLDRAGLWQDVQQAIDALLGPEPSAARGHLQAAADKLRAAREVLYPATIYILDLHLWHDGRLDQPLPEAIDKGLPVNVLAAASTLEKLARAHPERLALLRDQVQSDRVEVVGGPYLEREDALMPVESQLWNLLRGQAVYQELLGRGVSIYARRRFAAHPQLPSLLYNVGIHRALLLTFDQATLPSYRSAVTSWPAPDGKQVEAFTRSPHNSHDPQTFFHLIHYIHQTIMQDQIATLVLVHDGEPALPWYSDWLELQHLAPVLGQWTTFSRYLAEYVVDDYASAASADEFHSDYLEERTTARLEHPVSGFARQVRWRRSLDTTWSLVALHRGLTGPRDDPEWEQRLNELEERLECHGWTPSQTGELGRELAEVQRQVAEALASRLQVRAEEHRPGYMVLNPCSFTRRLALELEGLPGPLPWEGPLKAAQFDGDRARLVVEVPPFGFAWIPRESPKPAQPPARKLADPTGVRNEFFEAEIDSATGGLKALRDHRSRINRIGQQLVYNPGSVARLSQVKVTSTGPALGEVITEGGLLDDHNQLLARFRQRFRAWLGRPILELRIELFAEHHPVGYPWHAYYAARFAWRDERDTLLRGVNGTAYITSHSRPETPDFLEIRHGRLCTTIFPGGLPFHQRHGGRMLDVILVPEGETAQVFELGLGLDREQPMQTALGMTTPAVVVPTDKGPPHVGAAGWLFHLDAANVAVTSLRPAPGRADAVMARLLECASHSGPAEFRCVRNPQRAVVLNARQEPQYEANVNGDTVFLDISSGELTQLRIEFTA
ncbi:MAG: hypothetical protein NZ700_16490 [Gemmataceae bacterium]|nr:hypothetical protein [Gemmataceae bacterium]MDW8264334.1 hypothetical protein [Gemmataceae bacterium]